MIDLKIAGVEIPEEIDSRDLRALRRIIERKGIRFEDFVAKVIEKGLWEVEMYKLTTSDEKELREKKKLNKK